MERIKTTMTIFSEKEKAMFKALGQTKNLQFAEQGFLHVGELYKSACEKAFLEELSGPAVDSLRRTMKAWNESAIRRLSPEFDALIRLS